MFSKFCRRQRDSWRFLSGLPEKESVERSGLAPSRRSATRRISEPESHLNSVNLQEQPLRNLQSGSLVVSRISVPMPEVQYKFRGRYFHSSA